MSELSLLEQMTNANVTTCLLLLLLLHYYWFNSLLQMKTNENLATVFLEKIV